MNHSPHSLSLPLWLRVATMSAQIQARSQGSLEERPQETRADTVLSSGKGHRRLLEIPHFLLLDLPPPRLANRKKALGFLTKASDILFPWKAGFFQFFASVRHNVVNPWAVQTPAPSTLSGNLWPEDSPLQAYRIPLDVFNRCPQSSEKNARRCLLANTLFSWNYDTYLKGNRDKYIKIWITKNDIFTYKQDLLRPASKQIQLRSKSWVIIFFSVLFFNSLIWWVAFFPPETIWYL